MMTDLPAGPELDKLVAEAIGLPVAPLYGRMWRGTPDEVYHATEFLPMWAPSSLWRDAMLAAERSGLFDGRYLTRNGDWCVLGGYVHGVGMDCIASAPTGPHAICLAVLKLKERSDEPHPIG